MTRLMLILVLAALPIWGRWWKAESGPFTVYADGGERQAKELLEKLDLARRVFAGLGNGVGLPLPVVGYAIQSETRFRALRPAESAKGFYQSAAVKDFIVLQAGAMDTGRAAFHEYVHLVLNHTSGPLPQWLEEGLAEFYSTLEAANGKVRLGRAVGTHVKVLALTPLMSAAELGAVKKDSPEFHEASRAGIFYAQSWALVHMLRLDERYRAGFSGFLKLVERGDAVNGAFSQAFGKSMTEAVGDLRPYLQRTMLPYVEYGIDVGERGGELRVTEVDEIDGELAYAELAGASGRMEEAERVLGKLRKKQPETARLANALGLIALAEKRTEEAKKYFERAMEFSDTAAETYFEYAMLLRDTGGSKEAVRRNLEKAVERNPRYAEARFLLGVGAAREDRHAEALVHLEAAVAVFPRQSYFWHALAVSYRAAGKTEQARQAAQRALESAANPEQADMARAAMQLAASAPETKPEKRPEVVTPESWQNAKGGARVEGILERIECLGKSARFHVRAGGKTDSYLVEDPGAVLLKNFSSMTFEFKCGAQKPVAVVVEYKPESGVVTSIAFP